MGFSVAKSKENFEGWKMLKKILCWKKYGKSLLEKLNKEKISGYVAGFDFYFDSDKL